MFVWIPINRLLFSVLLGILDSLRDRQRGQARIHERVHVYINKGTEQLPFADLLVSANGSGEPRRGHSAVCLHESAVSIELGCGENMHLEPQQVGPLDPTGSLLAGRTRLRIVAVRTSRGSTERKTAAYYV